MQPCVTYEALRIPSVAPDYLQSLPTPVDGRLTPTVPVQTTAIFEIGIKGKLDPPKPHEPPAPQIRIAPQQELNYLCLLDRASS